MWVDERGSEVLTAAECRALLYLGYEQHRFGHLGIPSEGAPFVLPMDYGLSGPDVLVKVGLNVLGQATGRLVAFQVDGASDPPVGERAGREHRWSVLVRGLATKISSLPDDALVPRPHVACPGESYLRIRSDVVTGRRL